MSYYKAWEEHKSFHLCRYLDDFTAPRDEVIKFFKTWEEQTLLEIDTPEGLTFNNFVVME